MHTQTRISENFIEKFSTNVIVENLKGIKKEYVHKLNPEYAFLTQIKRVPKEYILESDFDVHNSFYSYAVPKLDCSFCFDHELDHIPFMMIVEIFRQIGVATSHTHHNIPLKGFKNTMDEMDFRSVKFVELDMPMLITCEDKVIKQTASVQKRKIFYKLYQNGILCAHMSTNIMVMSNEMYDRTRNKCRAEAIKGQELPLKPATNVEILDYDCQLV